MKPVVAATARVGINCKLGPGVVIDEGVTLGANCCLGAFTLIYAGTFIGDNSVVGPHCLVGFTETENGDGARIGPGAHIRSGSVIYAGVTAGEGLTTGHHCVIRKATLGNRVLVGTHAVIDGDAVVGDGVRLQTGSYVTRYTVAGDRVFFGPYARTTNDSFREGEELRGPVIGSDVRLGAGAVILPGVTVGEGSTLGAGAVVTRDVPPGVTMAGVPARPLRRKR